MTFAADARRKTIALRRTPVYTRACPMHASACRAADAGAGLRFRLAGGRVAFAASAEHVVETRRATVHRQRRRSDRFDRRAFTLRTLRPRRRQRDDRSRRPRNSDRRRQLRRRFRKHDRKRRASSIKGRAQKIVRDRPCRWSFATAMRCSACLAVRRVSRALRSRLRAAGRRAVPRHARSTRNTTFVKYPPPAPSAICTKSRRCAPRQVSRSGRHARERARLRRARPDDAVTLVERSRAAQSARSHRRFRITRCVAENRRPFGQERASFARAWPRKNYAPHSAARVKKA